MNSDNGDARVHDIDTATWIYHPDKNVDIAVLPFDCPDWAKRTVKSIPAKEFLDDKRADYYDVGAGDSVQIVGLFHLKPLKQKNLPIVHTGHIALFPTDETLPVGKGPDTLHVRGYLVEISGLDGSSGSPAYVRPTATFTSDAKEVPNNTAKTETTAYARLYLLGVWVGAWPGKPDETLKKEFGLHGHAMVPVGMGIVIPAPRITDILELEVIQAMRKEAVRKRDEGFPLRALASTIARPSTDENPTHREDFSRLLDVAAKTPPRAD